MSSKAIVVKLEIGDDGQNMSTHCLGERTIVRAVTDLPVQQPAYAIAQLLCHQHGWTTDLVSGLLPNGDEVFCFRDSGRCDHRDTDNNGR